MVILNVWYVCEIICIADDVQRENELWDLTTSRSLFGLFFIFSYKFFHSSFEIHSVLVTGTEATCCVYLKNLIAIADRPVSGQLARDD